MPPPPPKERGKAYSLKQFGKKCESKRSLKLRKKREGGEKGSYEKLNIHKSGKKRQKGA
jgi:hypothetical protein